MDNRKETVWALMLSLIATIVFAAVFSRALFTECIVYYDLDDYSFLSEHPDSTSYDEQQMEDLRSTITASGYEVVERNHFVLRENDPIIHYDIPETKLNKVKILFSEPTVEKMTIKISYVNAQAEVKTVEDTIPSGSKECEFEWESDNLTDLNLTIGDTPGTSFEIAKIQIMNDNVKYWSFMNMVKLEGIFIAGYFFIRKLTTFLFKTSRKV